MEINIEFTHAHLATCNLSLKAFAVLLPTIYADSQRVFIQTFTFFPLFFSEPTENVSFFFFFFLQNPHSFFFDAFHSVAYWIWFFFFARPYFTTIGSIVEKLARARCTSNSPVNSTGVLCPGDDNCSNSWAKYNVRVLKSTPFFFLHGELGAVALWIPHKNLGLCQQPCIEPFFFLLSFTRIAHFIFRIFGKLKHTNHWMLTIQTVQRHNGIRWIKYEFPAIFLLGTTTKKTKTKCSHKEIIFFIFSSLLSFMCVIHS